jgi:hypothetical protein
MKYAAMANYKKRSKCTVGMGIGGFVQRKKVQNEVCPFSRQNKQLFAAL